MTAPAYEVRVSRSALKSLARIDRKEQLRLRAVIDLLAQNPRPPASTPLVGETDVFRVRVGNYRIVYEVLAEVLVIHVVALGHRLDVYRS